MKMLFGNCIQLRDNATHMECRVTHSDMSQESQQPAPLAAAPLVLQSNLRPITLCLLSHIS